MAEKLVTAVEVQASVTGDGSVKTLRAELREAVQAAAELADKFGEASPQATEAAKRVANLRDRMEDLNNRVKALNPDKFQRFATFASGIANGFQAAQGAMALFGAESEDVQKQLVRIQGAIAFAQGIQGIKDFAQSFKGVGTEIAGVVRGLGALKTALLATGIGAVAIAIGYVINNLQAWTKEEEEAAKAATEHAFAMEMLNAELDKEAGLLSDVEFELKKLNIERRKAIEEIQNEALQTAIKGAISIGNADLIKDLLLGKNPILAALTQVNKAIEEAQEKSKAKIQSINEEYDLREQIAQKKADNAAAKAAEQAAKNITATKQQAIQRDDELLNMAGDARLKQIEQQNAKEIELSETAQTIIEQRGELNRKRREKARADELAAEQAAADARLSIANSTAQGLSAIADIIATAGGKATAAQKAAALAQIGIDTASAISSMLKGVEAASAATGPAYPITKVALYATGIATILSNVARAKALLSQSSVGGVAAAGAGAFSSAPPQAGARTFTGFGLPSDQIETAGGGQQMRVYVVDSDITRQQKRSRAIQRTSVI